MSHSTNKSSMTVTSILKTINLVKKHLNFPEKHRGGDDFRNVL